MAGVTGPLSSTPQVGTTQATSTTTAPSTSSTPTTQSVLGTASGFGTTSTFAADPASTTAANRALDAIRRAVPNLPVATLSPLQDAAQAKVNALLAQKLPVTQLQTELNKVVADYNTSVNGAIMQQQLAQQRTGIIQRAQSTLDQKITRVDAPTADAIRQQAKAQVDALLKTNPPLSNTALQAGLDKIVRSFVNDINAAAGRQYAAGYVLGMLKVANPAMDPAAFDQYREAAMKELSDAEKAQPPLSEADFRTAMNKIRGELSTEFNDAIQSKIAVDRALSDMARNDPRLKLPAGSEGTLQKLREAYTKILRNALAAKPPPTLKDIKDLVAKSTADFKTSLGKLAKGEKVTIPNADPVDKTTTDNDADARKKLVDQAIADLNGMDTFETSDGRQMKIADALDAGSVKNYRDQRIKNIQDFANKQPPPSLTELKDYITDQENHYMGDLAFEKSCVDYDVSQMMARMKDYQDKIKEAIEG